MEHKLFDSERRVMELLWQHGDLTAKELSQQLAETADWNKNTTYTVIKKCVEKGYIHPSGAGVPLPCPADPVAGAARMKPENWSIRSFPALPHGCLHPCSAADASTKTKSTSSAA